jgi:Uma2 family endonuclease
MSALATYLEADSGAQQPHLLPLTVSAYHRMAESGILDLAKRTELIDGRIITMPPIGTQHADWVDRLTRLFIKTLPEDCRVRPQNPVYLDEFNEPEPDIALLKSRQQPYSEAHPRPEDVLLIIEVADTSLPYDRDVKLPLYARHAIPEVWLLDVTKNRLEIFRQPAQGDYRVHLKPLEDESITLFAMEEICVDLAQLF